MEQPCGTPRHPGRSSVSRSGAGPSHLSPSKHLMRVLEIERSARRGRKTMVAAGLAARAFPTSNSRFSPIRLLACHAWHEQTGIRSRSDPHGHHVATIASRGGAYAMRPLFRFQRAGGHQRRGNKSHGVALRSLWRHRRSRDRPQPPAPPPSATQPCANADL